MPSSSVPSSDRPSDAPRIARDAVNTLTLHFGTSKAENSLAAHPDMSMDIRHAADAYGFLIQRNETLTFSAFADRIEKHYAQDEPRNRHIVQQLRAYAQQTSTPAPQAVVLVSETLGIYLGECLGLGFWSMLDPAGQDAAITFPSEIVAREHVGTWQDQPQDLRCVAVAADPDGYASVEACVAAGLPAWHPTAQTSDDIPTSTPRG